MKYTQIKTDAFKELQLNAGIFVDAFNPVTGVIGNILWATSGGCNFVDTPEYTDFGEDVDNCPKNTKELKKITGREIKMSGTILTITAAITKTLIGAADVAGNKITPRADLKTSDFHDVWWIGDYSDQNGAANGGFVAIHLMNALSTTGFQLQSTEKGKGTFAFELTGHYSINAPNTIPYEVYVKVGTAEAGDYLMSVTSVAGATSGKTAITVGASAGSGESYVYQTGYGLYTPDEGQILAGSAWTSWDGSAAITATTGMDIVVCIKDSDNKAKHAGKTIVTAHE